MTKALNRSILARRERPKVINKVKDELEDIIWDYMELKRLEELKEQKIKAYAQIVDLIECQMDATFKKL